MLPATYGVSLPVQDVFSGPTIAERAEAVSGDLASGVRLGLVPAR